MESEIPEPKRHKKEIKSAAFYPTADRVVALGNFMCENGTFILESQDFTCASGKRGKLSQMNTYLITSWFALETHGAVNVRCNTIALGNSKVADENDTLEHNAVRSIFDQKSRLQFVPKRSSIEIPSGLWPEVEDRPQGKNFIPDDNVLIICR